MSYRVYCGTCDYTIYSGYSRSSFDHYGSQGVCARCVADKRKKDWEREKAAREERFRQNQRDHEKRMKEATRSEIRAAITRVKGQITVCENNASSATGQLATQNTNLLNATKQINESTKDIEMFEVNSKKKLDEMKTEIEKKQEQYKAADDKIKDAIAATNVSEGNIPQFLTLINDGLLFATMRGAIEADQMTEKIKLFGELIERTCSVNLPINTYFKTKGLQRIVPILAAEGYKTMMDIKCDDKKDWDGGDDSLEKLIENGLKEHFKNDKKKQKFLNKERRDMKKFCLQADTTWLPDQKDKENITRQSLMTAAPKLSNFFGTLHSALDDIAQLLAYDSKLNDKQRKAIADAPSLKIEEVKDDEKEPKKQSQLNPREKEERQKWGIGSGCLIYSESTKIWINGTIVEIVCDSNGERLKVEYEIDKDKKSFEIERFSKIIKPISGENKRKQWSKGSECEIFSTTEQKWYKGKIIDIKDENDEEWLVIEYFVDDKKKLKEIGRFAEGIREFDLTQSKDVSKMQFDQEEVNVINSQCATLQNIVITQLHVAESMKNEFTVDEKERETFDKEIRQKLDPLEKELNAKRDQLDDIKIDIATIEEELELIREEEEKDDDDEDDDDNDSDNDSDSDTEDNKKRKKELKKQKKKSKLKKKKVSLQVDKFENKIQLIKAQGNIIKSREDVLKETFIVVESIEDSVAKLLETQCITRQSILLAREIHKYKPANPTGKAETLWTVIGKGIGDIFENAIRLNKISSQYYAFFKKFQQSFGHFITANRMNENVSMIVAAEHLIKDVSDIQIFQKELDVQMEKLRNSAIVTIRECILNAVGAKEFDDAMDDRKKAEQELREENEKYDTEKMAIDNEFKKKFSNNQKWVAAKGVIEHKMEQLKHEQKSNEKQVENLRSQLAELNTAISKV